MLTPQEIQEKKFEKALLGGYDMSQVDSFLDQVLADYSSLYKENATLKSKMRVLVDKIEEYRAVDDEMRKALYNAQITAQEIESKARREAEETMRSARDNAAATIRDLQNDIERENRRLEEAKALCEEFGRKMQAALAAGSRELEALLTKPADQLDAPAPAPAPAPVFDLEAQQPARPEEPAQEDPFVPEEITQEAADELEGIDVPDFSARKAGELNTRFYEVEMKEEPGAAEDKLRMFAPKPRFDFSTLTNKENDKERE